LLLQSLANATHATHPDHRNITLALQRIKEIADLINQRKKEFDSFNELLQVNQLIEPPIKVQSNQQ
jgi:predicted NACHT family NTPase